MITRREALEELARRKLAVINRYDAEVAPVWFHSAQVEAWLCEHREIVCLAGAQGGKTAIQAYWLLRELQRCLPFISKQGSGVALYVGPTLELLRKQAIPAFRRLFEVELQLGKFTENPGRFVFSTEGLLKLFGTASYPVSIWFAYANDSSNLESVTACCGVWDETGQKENRYESFEAFNRRLIAARSAGFGRALFGTTPYEWGWFKTFVDQVPEGALINFPSWANPINDRAVIEAEKGRMPLWRWEMMYLGRYTRPAGQVFDCFTDKNLARPGDIPDDWSIYTGVDFGSTNMAAVHLAEELDEHGVVTGRYYLYARYKGSSKSLKEHAEGILDEGGRKPQRSQGGSHQEQGWREACLAGGLKIHEPHINDVRIQYDTVYAAFKTGRLFISADLDDVLAQIERFSYELDSEGNPIEKYKDEQKYHYLAALRYICVYLFGRNGEAKLIGSRVNVTHSKRRLSLSGR